MKADNGETEDSARGPPALSLQDHWHLQYTSELIDVDVP
jgi:hypothetical protein